MTIRNKLKNHTKHNELMAMVWNKSIEKDPNGYDGILWPVITATAAPVVDSPYEEDVAISIDEVENETELGEPELIVLVDFPNKVSGLDVDASGDEFTGEFEEPIAVKINKIAIPEGSVVMFKVETGANESKPQYYAVQAVRGIGSQAMTNIYYLLPFSGDFDLLSDSILLTN
ncbi:hypothetical protein KO527_05350 [Pseudoalteromonas sp. C2R02]|uniref:hypothetical protein n=1 Tax=Pseudoalteromonas sp. C2R02 TaxID=2841565 RepID=UPI001C0A659C|nr:hypothetical protein [Pseudoalteromonas sp. C2R02]MBU2968774.1 hypothetical protein [Pseudoalteromonas sp. C2R02]